MLPVSLPVNKGSTQVPNLHAHESCAAVTTASAMQEDIVGNLKVEATW